MLQIKTVRRADPCEFDEAVNAALAEGWDLIRRHVFPDHFVAELEKVIITAAERDCDNCEYCDTEADSGPCSSCQGFSNWTDPNA